MCPQNGASQARYFKLKVSRRSQPERCWTRRARPGNNRSIPENTSGGVDMRKLPIMLAAAALTVATQASAQEKVKVGILTTLSGPPAALGVQQRNGFQLALKTLGGKLGGREVELLVQDDELKPDVAVGKAKALTERDKVEFVVGPVFSNILIAMMKPVTDSGVILISPNAGTSNFAGKECNPNFFVTSYQNDQNAEAMGKC